MNSYTRSKTLRCVYTNQVRATSQWPAREKRTRNPVRAEVVAAMLAGGILVLLGGAVFAATRPTWHPSRNVQAASETSQAALHRADAAHGRVAQTRGGAARAGTGRHTAGARSLTDSRRRTRPRVVAPTAAAGVSSITYTVKRGDTLAGIAAWFR
jgi:nucleoid-associated protein YgaU